MSNVKKKQVEEIDKLLQRLDNSGVADYIKLSQNPWKILWFNFLSGIARGLGFTVGTTIVLGVIYKVVKQLLSMVELPYVAEYLASFLEMVNKNMQ